jgi:ADP-ribosylglycohydrolase
VDLRRVAGISDDTQLTLATCEAVVTSGGRVEPEAIARSFLRWYREEKLSGLGAATLGALRGLDAGGHWATVGRTGEMAAGNGAAMRIAPLAFCFDPASEEGRVQVRDVSRITHRNDEAYVGALAIAVAVRMAAVDWPGTDALLVEIAGVLPDSVVKDRLLTLAGLPPSFPVTKVAELHGASGYVADSVPLALWAVRQHAGDSLDVLLRDVIAAGGDTDTVASMALQIVGTRIGYEALSRSLVEAVPEIASVEAIARSFANVVAG